jgi:hypothetical protein
VFYIKANASDGWQYLEAAPASAEFTAQWGATHVDGTKLGLGDGKWNTLLIADALSNLGEFTRAAPLCMEMSQGGFRDWYLPSSGRRRTKRASPPGALTKRNKSRKKGEYENQYSGLRYF